MIVMLRGLSYRVSELVCRAFHGEPEPGDKCVHLNANILDNRPANLRWYNKEERKIMSLFTIERVRYLRKTISDGEIIKRMGIPANLMQDIH
jgi:hypothetical protein